MQLNYSLSQLAEIVGGDFLGEDKIFTSLESDTRVLKAGDLFIAIQGDNFDGNNFVASAKQKGACGALVSKKTVDDFPLVVVNDTKKALGLLAAYHRSQFKVPLIAVTGSCGKTTCRAMLESILSQVGETLASISSLNNDVGVPLTLLRLEKKHQYAVSEMGTNHFGEIDYLTRLAQPELAIITNVAPVHVEYLKDLAGVARAKGEIFNGLSSRGIGIIPADSDFTDYWRSLLANKRVLTFGSDKKADVYSSDIKINEVGRASFILHTNKTQIQINLPLLGKHNVLNALAVSAACLALDLSLPQIKIGLEKVAPEKKRLVETKTFQGGLLIDDTYNANPTSVRAAIEVLMSSPGEDYVLVLGDMAELGDKAKQFHQEVGDFARAHGVNALYAYGDWGKFTVESFGEHGHFYADKTDLINALKENTKQSQTILVKGSRSATMEDVVIALQ